MSHDTDAFMLANPRVHSKLALVETEIFDMLLAGATYAQISGYLKSKGIVADRSEIFRYVKRQECKRSLTTVISGLVGPREKDSVEEVCAKSPQKEEIAKRHPTPSVESGPILNDPALPQFNWAEAKKDCKLKW